MNIDHRLDRLVERREALAESVQLLTRDVESLAESVKMRARYLSDIMEGAARLLPVARTHEQRLEGHEGS